MTDCAHERLPLVSRMKTRSRGSTKVCILRRTLTWSYPVFDRESEAITSPSRVMMPTQYVISPPFRGTGRAVTSRRMLN
jgi:hypothetical protein